MSRKVPAKLTLHKVSKELSVDYGQEESYRLPAEFLRVLSPSAEVRGHGRPVLQTGKLHVGLSQVEAVGHYAIKLIFDDGHDSGIYNWDYLYDLCSNREAHWDNYLKQLHEAGASRDPDASVVKLV
ncbi:DUF971 domain-containing protein [Endozoicomonas sp. Mp262]|uniref:DUF971 domain-containing protein n=1 Tax=Endozoicomonas sp. Mp262 TaxID=2919499 RepID=UPI0021DA4CDE